MFDISTIIDLTEKLGIIQAVKGKLLRQPDEAADKLVLILDELSKIYTTIEAELVRYLSLNFDPQENLAEERAVLLTLESGQLEARVAEARGHCHKIGNIYWKYLQRWFQRVLKPDEAQQLESVFMDLSNADTGMVLVLDQLVQWLAPHATDTLDLVDAGHLDEANQRLHTARKEVQAVRQAIARALVDLRNLQAEFIDISGTV